MAGIYIHIPFCKQKCHYCNFFSVASLKNKAAFIQSLKKEIEAQKNYLKGEQINTIYFGGGTPSLLSLQEMMEIFDQINKYFSISNEAEITFEVNPDDVNSQTMNELSGSFVNRISIGVQSFFDDDLKYLNRIHQGKQAIKSVKLAQDAGFENMSIDLIYGIPTLTNQKWEQNLNTFFDLNIPHLSAYALTVEPKTALDLLIRKKKVESVDEKQMVQHFEFLMDAIEKNNFIHYEVSNFSKEGYYSKHNSLYWLGGNYLGLGPSAHSYNGNSRQWNVSSISTYIQTAFKEGHCFEKEILSKQQQLNEYIMTSLRTSWGCDLFHIENVFGSHYKELLLRSSSKHLQNKNMILQNNILFLSRKGKLYADGIASDLFTD